MTNIVPQLDKLNRGAWLATEETVECYRDQTPLKVLGGAVYGGAADDDYFAASHGTRTPSAFWKVIVGDPNVVFTEDYGRVAVWMDHTVTATRSTVADWLVSFEELEDLLAAYGQAETFDFVPAGEKNHTPAAYPPRPSGCNLG